MLDLAPLDPEVSRAVSRQLSEELTRQLAEAFVLVPEAEVDRVRSGADLEPDVSDANKLLVDAKQQLSNGQNKQAQKLIKSARAILDPLRPKLRDYTPLTSALLYSAVAAMNLADKKGTQLFFADLARLRPGFQIDPAEFPPNVLEAFEKARQAEVKFARGRLLLTSTPAGAKAFVDEVPVGVTPVTVPASPGEHLVRLEQDGFLSWTRALTVESYAKIDTQAALARNAARDGLHILETDTVQGTAPGSFSAPARTVAAELKADAVVIGIAALSVKGYLASVAYLPRGEGAAQVNVVEIDRSLKDKKEALGKIAQAVILASRAKGAPDSSKIQAAALGDAPTRKVNFGKFALGLAPGGSSAVLADAAAQREALNLKAAAPLVEPPPNRWWLWVGGGVLVAAAAGGTAAYFVTRPGHVQFELQRQP